MLTEAGAQIAAGDYARRTALHTGDEIETLSRSFDAMADAVQEKIADLQADVQRREDFVGAFTHELKTPMTSIIGYADILATMQTDPAEQREAAAAIAHEGRRLEALSHKLLALLGLSEEALTLTAVPLDSLWPRLRRPARQRCCRPRRPLRPSWPGTPSCCWICSAIWYRTPCGPPRPAAPLRCTAAKVGMPSP